MRRSDNAVELGKFVYFLTSPDPLANQALIMAHGALTGTFETTPVRLFFYARHGETLKNVSVSTIYMARTLGDRLPEQIVAANGTYPDMDLSKVLGRGGDNSTAEPVAGSDDQWSGHYQGVHQRQIRTQRQGAVPPHCVFIRHRRMRSKTIKLSEVIGLIRAHNAAINEIWVAACRSYTHREGGRLVVDEFKHLPGVGGRRGAVVGSQH